MNELQVFTSPEFGTVRTMLIDNEPWAVGKDVAAALGYKDTKSALQDHIDPEDKQILKSGEMPPLAIPTRGMTIINESGMYSLILSSKLPNAKKFKRWVTSEILPSIRKTGSYSAQDALPRVLTADDYLTAARILSGCRNERLPYIIPLIKKAGIEIDIALKANTTRGNMKDPETARLLNTAFSKYGVKVRELGRLTGIHTNQLCRMRNGTTRYNEARAAIIRDALHALVPELEIEAVTAET